MWTRARVAGVRGVLRWRWLVPSVGAWLLAIVMIFPLAWMVLTAFKTEGAAYSDPPKILFHPTLVEFRGVVDSGLVPYLEHSVIDAVGSTLIVLCLAIPAAYALSINSVPRYRDALFFFFSSKVMPLACVVPALFAVAVRLRLADTSWVLILLYATMNLPLAVWMLRTFMLDLPKSVFEAAAVEGASTSRQIRDILLPLIARGAASTGLLCLVFAWNESFLAVNLTATRAGTLPVFLQSFFGGQRPYFAELAAAATIVSIPVIAGGWLAQKKIAYGLSMSGSA